MNAIETPELNPLSIFPQEEVIQEVPPEIKKDLLDQYAYHQGEEEPKRESSTLSESKTPTAQKVEIEQITNPVNLYDMSFFCEERIHRIRFEPMETKQKKFNEVKQKRLYETLEIFAEYSQPFEFNSIVDKFYYKNGLILVPEEFYTLTGLLRKYFDIEKVLVIFNTGELLVRESKFCNFWTEDKLAKFQNFNPANLHRPEILYKKKCLECNLVCPFRHEQQIGK